MKIIRVVESVALFAVLPAAGVIACGSQDQNPGPGTQSPTGAPTIIGGQPPVIGGQPPVIGGQPPVIGGQPPTGTGTPPTGTGVPPTGTGVPPTPTGTGVPPTPTGTGVPPTPTGTGVPPTPTGTGVPPTPTGTGTPPPPANGLPPIPYDANHVLLPPDPANGIQIATPTFSLPPGSEQFKCYHTSLPGSTETDVGRWASQMTPGSHHFILYAGGTSPDGQMDSTGCVGFGNTWLYASSSPDNQLPMPAGVAMPEPAGQKIEFDMHYINTTSAPLDVHILLNVDKVTGNFQRAGALVSFNSNIAVPPMGTQTVSGTCPPPAGANFFLMSTHTHKHATLATIHEGSATGTELVHTTDWENPDFHMWQTAPFYQFPAGQGLYYACTYQNDTTSTIYVGTSAITNEMCMAVTYYFPSSGGGGISCR